MISRSAIAMMGAVAAVAGCVMVETPDVRVGVVGSPPAREPAPAEPTPPHAEMLGKVIRQQDEVAKELAATNWDEVVDEAGDWVEYARALSGYAGSSPDPPRFRALCDEMLHATQAVRRAATDRDARRCARAIDACDPILDELARRFPMTGPSPAATETKTAPSHVP